MLQAMDRSKELESQTCDARKIETLKLVERRKMQQRQLCGERVEWFSDTGERNAADLEEFRRQVACTFDRMRLHLARRADLDRSAQGKDVLGDGSIRL